MKNQILLKNYYFPTELEERLQRFVQYYNDECQHKSLSDLKPTNEYCDREGGMLRRRALIKRNTLLMRREMHSDKQATLMR
jgi:hypothetical protein